MMTRFAIERFRSLRQLKLEGLGRVNLITGRNNTGKSSVLEALRILAWNAWPTILLEILRNREEDFGEVHGEGWSVDGESLPALSNLFTGFPQISEINTPIVISANDGKKEMQLAISVELFNEQRGADGIRSLVPQQLSGSTPLSEMALIPALVVQSESGRSITPLDSFSQSARRRIQQSRKVV
jgi:hypothetical protein